MDMLPSLAETACASNAEAAESPRLALCGGGTYLHPAPRADIGRIMTDQNSPHEARPC